MGFWGLDKKSDTALRDARNSNDSLRNRRGRTTGGPQNARNSNDPLRNRRGLTPGGPPQIHLTPKETICQGRMVMSLQSLVSSRWKEPAGRVPGNIRKSQAGKGGPVARPYSVSVGQPGKRSENGFLRQFRSCGCRRPIAPNPVGGAGPAPRPKSASHRRRPFAPGEWT